MEMTDTAMFASLLVSSIGLSLFVYGKKQVRAPQLSVGLALMVLPYAVGSALPIIGVGAASLLALHLALRNGL